jgi:hypothetical protein
MNTITKKFKLCHPYTQLLTQLKTKFKKIVEVQNKNKVIMILSSTTRFFPAEFFTMKTRLQQPLG